MKYFLIIESRGDYFTYKFDTVEEAFRAADLHWEKYMTESERKKCKDFYVMENMVEDEEDPGYFDGMILRSWV